MLLHLNTTLDYSQVVRGAKVPETEKRLQAVFVAHQHKKME